jgi:hypothetical protein
MRTPDTWVALEAEQLTEVDPTYELRPLADDVVQYVDRNGTQYLATHTPSGYGEAAEGAPHTLRRIVSGADISIYEVPPYVVSVPAITRERRNAEALTSLYNAIGRLLYEATISEDTRPPVVRIADVAVNVRSNELYFLPPLTFTEADVTPNVYERWMNQSIADSLGNSLPESTIKQLQSAVTQGIKQ